MKYDEEFYSLVVEVCRSLANHLAAVHNGLCANRVSIPPVFKALNLRFRSIVPVDHTGRPNKRSVVPSAEHAQETGRTAVRD